MESARLLKTHKTFEGQTQFWEHDSIQTKTKMKFSTFMPSVKPRGCVIWLSGLTCTDENFITKAGAQKYLQQHGLMVLCPDTSPRGLNLPQEHEHWDFGSGAGFYVDATTSGYQDHYRMESYVCNEVHSLIQEQFGVAQDKISLMGHSMGGHGALVLALRHPEKFQSASAFSPIVHPSECPWGQKAFAGYLGADKSQWCSYDTTELIKLGKKHPRPFLVDQGLQDEFLDKQLLTDHLEQACEKSGQKCLIHRREGYDHSYYFIASFIESHIRFHAEYL